jgi:hypothetical protein
MPDISHSVHAAEKSIVGLIANIRAGLRQVKQAAKQLTAKDHWDAVVRAIVE